MKKIIVFLCVVVTVILAAGCLYNGNADRTTPTDAVNLEALQKLYKKAPEYEYMQISLTKKELYTKHRKWIGVQLFML